VLFRKMASLIYLWFADTTVDREVSNVDQIRLENAASQLRAWSAA